MSTSAANLACIGEPISWLRLETFAAGSPDASVDTHVAECPACRHCLEQLRADTVALPALVMPSSVKKAQRAWWKTAAPLLAAAAAAAVIFIVAKRPGGTHVVREDVAIVKGVGEVILGTVRERGGAIAEDAHTFAPGDRWKLVLTCPPADEVHTDVTVVELDTKPYPDRPLAPATIACGNRVVLPGAFTLTGAHANRVCVSFDATTQACVTIAPE
ncbi:MAG TPA: hypothetical protein VGM90_12420 [Kofleriaceae bacterium]|jgi:hypothetical protein